ncbi:MAG: glycosyl hydrolase family 28-related protein [Verrucomicrobiales bacterium]
MNSLLIAGLLARVSIADFGAVPDDGLDDSAAIAAAVHSTKGRQNDVIYVPAGIWNTSQPITLHSWLGLAGEGAEKSVIKSLPQAPNWGVTMLGTEAALVQNVSVLDLTLDCAGLDMLGGIAAYWGRKFHVAGVHVKNVGGVRMSAGVHWIKEVDDTIIERCLFENISWEGEWGAGVRCSWGSDHCRMVKNVARHVSRIGFGINNGGEWGVISGNVAEDIRKEKLGAELWQGGDRTIIEDNTLDNWLSLGGCKYVAARRNVIGTKRGVGYCGFEIGDGNSCVVGTDNMVDGGQCHGLAVSGAGRRDFVYLARNTFNRSTTYGATTTSSMVGDQVNEFWYHYANAWANTLPANNPDVAPSEAPWGHGGYGLRLYGGDKKITYDACVIIGNPGAALAVLMGGENLMRIDWKNCRFIGNGRLYFPIWLASSYPKDMTWTNNQVIDTPRLGPYGAAHDGFMEPTQMYDPKKAAEAQHYIGPLRIIHTGERTKGVVNRFHIGGRENLARVAGVLWDFSEGIPAFGLSTERVFSVGDKEVTAVLWLTDGTAKRVLAAFRID